MPKSVLLVEDSMIIALDAEDCLLDLGIETVHVESTVNGALGVLEANSPDFALLDYNLGTESSEAVAAELAQRGIPFWIATGYGEMDEVASRTGAYGVLTKPYGKPELAEIVEQYRGGAQKRAALN